MPKGSFAGKLISLKSLNFGFGIGVKWGPPVRDLLNKKALVAIARFIGNKVVLSLVAPVPLGGKPLGFAPLVFLIFFFESLFNIFKRPKELYPTLLFMGPLFDLEAGFGLEAGAFIEGLTFKRGSLLKENLFTFTRFFNKGLKRALYPRNKEGGLGYLKPPPREGLWGRRADL